MTDSRIIKYKKEEEQIQRRSLSIMEHNRSGRNDPEASNAHDFKLPRVRDAIFRFKMSRVRGEIVYFHLWCRTLIKTISTVCWHKDWKSMIYKIKSEPLISQYVFFYSSQWYSIITSYANPKFPSALADKHMIYPSVYPTPNSSTEEWCQRQLRRYPWRRCQWHS